MKLYNDYSLLAHNTFGMDVRAAQFVEYATVGELCEFLASDTFAQYRTRFIHIGSGSNLLFAGDYSGLVMHSVNCELTVVEDTPEYQLLRGGAGYVWDDFVAYCVEHQLAGVENLSAIPGEVGASAVQNIGAYGVEVCDVIERVETVDLMGNPRVFGKDECRYG